VPAFGEAVQLEISKQLIANAEYYPGKENKPSIMILHGFMMTHNFPTVKQLAESLNESDYTILTPSLTLDINQRKKSLACEAIHTHSVEKDILELDQWMQWLQKKSQKPIILIGHSAGSILLAKYLSSYTSDSIKEVIFITMPNFNIASQKDKINQLQVKAEKLLADNDHSLHEFKLSYCDKYATSAEHFLSYLQLSKKNITSYLKTINKKKSLIVGSEDKRVDLPWAETLSAQNVNVIRLEGANHFFSDEYEFELLDIIENILSDGSKETK